jgi:hypothetical protein
VLTAEPHQGDKLSVLGRAISLWLSQCRLESVGRTGAVGDRHRDRSNALHQGLGLFQRHGGTRMDAADHDGRWDSGVSARRAVRQLVGGPLMKAIRIVLPAYQQEE